MNWISSQTPFTILSFLAICLVNQTGSQNPIPSFMGDIIEEIDELSPPQNHLPDLTPFDLRAEYDFIIVGSGPGGSVLANRLTENPNVNVLLLEAGGLPSTLHTIPSYGIFADRPQDRWDFTINPSPGSCLGSPRQQCIYGLGKLLGGSSSFNYMVWTRGNRNDYDGWKRMGNYGWGYDDLLPLFQSVENATMVSGRAPGIRGLKGPLSVSTSPFRTGIVENFLEAINSHGTPTMDFNGPMQLSANYAEASMKDGRRHSAMKAFLEPIFHRRNLHIMINSLVSRVLIDPLTKTANGVEFIHQQRQHRVRTTKEVVLSAGPVMSPQLLMLSGVGPREDLTKFNIPLIKELPVGKQYMDHITSGLYIFRINTTGENVNLQEIDSDDAKEFVRFGTGKLTIPATIEAIAFLNNGLLNVPADQPEVEILFSPGKNEVGFNSFPVPRQDIYDSVWKPIEDPSIEVFSMSILDLYPKTRGSIKLRGSSINNPPIIEFPFFQNASDFHPFLRTIKRIVALTETPTMRRIGARLYSVPIPDCAPLRFGTDKYWECHVRHFSRNVCHAAGTNKMGPSGDREAVVDPELRVHGVNNLRVADSSIAPTLIAGHTQALAYVVGQKMSLLLKQQWDI